MVKYSLATVAVVCVAGAGGPALAWGPEGHAMVAEIAEARLAPAAKAKVTALLAMDSKQHLDEVASWADDVRSDKTAAWHFVDIPLPDVYKASRDCTDGDCVVGKIRDFSKALATDQGNDQFEDLKWVVHFVGDIHQPLHCETNFDERGNSDRGGNDVKVVYLSARTELHHVWDTSVIQVHYNLPKLKLGQAPDYVALRKFSAALEKAVTAQMAVKWAPDGLTGHLGAATSEWANASHRLAQTAYAKLPDGDVKHLDATYQTYAWPVVQTQLQAAGVRLAEILNEALQ